MECAGTRIIFTKTRVCSGGRAPSVKDQDSISVSTRPTIRSCYRSAWCCLIACNRVRNTNVDLLSFILMGQCLEKWHVAFINYHLWILGLFCCCMVDWHRDAVVSTVGPAVKRLWAQFQLDGFYVLFVSVWGFSRYSTPSWLWLETQENGQELDHRDWQPKLNLLTRDKTPIRTVAFGAGVPKLRQHGD